MQAPSKCLQWQQILSKLSSFVLRRCRIQRAAVKAIGLAASQGQKIYTITPEVYANNPNIVNSNLSAHSQSTKQGIQNALDAGMEVTVHDAPIAQSGWTGSGYTFIDPQTGAGGYIIDGGTNGSVLPNSPIDVVGRNSDTLAIILFGLGVIALAAKVTIVIGLLLAVTAFVISSMAFMAAHLAALEYASNCPEALPCIEKIFMTVFLINTVLSLASLAINPAVAIAMAFSGLLFGDSLAQAAGMRCTNIACPRTT